MLSAACGALGGLLSGFLGVGGNVVLIPLLALTLGLSQHQAQGLTLAALLPPVGLPAVWHYRRAGLPILWPVVGAAVLGFGLSVPLGSALAGLAPADLLRGLFAVLLLVTAVRTWRQQPVADGAVLSQTPRPFFLRALLAGAGSGFAAGLLGIGGAILFIPLTRRFFGLGQKQAQLTSLAVLLFPVALPGVLVYAHMKGGLPWSDALPVAAGFIVGAFFGGQLARVVSPARLSKAFAVLLATAAVLLATAALRGP